MLRERANKGEIARALYRDKSTIKREIKRGSVVQRRANPYASRNPSVPDHIEEMQFSGTSGSTNTSAADRAAAERTK